MKNIDYQYITDNLGNKISVIVPFTEWKDFLCRHRKLRKRLKILRGIRNGFSEVKKSRANKIPLRGLKDFLNENKR